jgi:hypothetical protein
MADQVKYVTLRAILGEHVEHACESCGAPALAVPVRFVTGEGAALARARLSGCTRCDRGLCWGGRVIAAWPDLIVQETPDG